MGGVGDDEEVDMLVDHPSLNTTPIALEPNAFREYYNDQSQLPPTAKLAYIILMQADKENAKLMEEYNKKDAAGGVPPPTIFTPESYVKFAEPLATFAQKGKGIRSVVASKAQMGQELTRRLPGYKSNWKNKSVLDIMKILLENPLVDEGDTQYIESEYDRMMMIIQNQIDADSLENDSDRIGHVDTLVRLKFIVILCTNETVLTAYRRHTNAKTVTEIDYKNSEKAPPSWKDLMCEAFNNPEEMIMTALKPTLHDDFKVQIQCDTTNFKLTPDRCDDIMTAMKKKIRTIVNKYNLSGNGSDMARFDDDTDNEDDTDEIYDGHFNQDKSIKRAERRGLTIIDGDDQKSFLDKEG